MLTIRTVVCMTKGPADPKTDERGLPQALGSEIEVHVILVGVWVHAHRSDLVRLLVVEPCVDEVLGEDVAFSEELVVIAQGLKGCFE